MLCNADTEIMRYISGTYSEAHVDIGFVRYHDGQGFLRCRRRGGWDPLLKTFGGYSSGDGAGDSGEWLKVQYPCIANLRLLCLEI
jgi:hypothetical protein